MGEQKEAGKAGSRKDETTEQQLERRIHALEHKVEALHREHWGDSPSYRRTYKQVVEDREKEGR